MLPARVSAVAAVLLLWLALVAPAQAQGDPNAQYHHAPPPQQQQHYQQQQQHLQQQQQVHDRMNELVDSVKDAVRDADNAAASRDVVDLGQSLSLLESKFSGLRQALELELGSNAHKLSSNSVVTRDITQKSTDLVKSVIGQRDELRRLVLDVRHVNDAMLSLKESMMSFDRDVAELNRLMGELHHTHNELAVSHEHTRNTLAAAKEAGALAVVRPSYTLFYVALVVELIGFVAFLYIKRPGRALAHKAYGKFG